jgi:ATP-binding cassette subfamily C protein
MLFPVGHVLSGLCVFSACLNLLALTGPLFMLQIYDRVLPSASVPTLMLLSILAAALFCFYAILDLLRRRVLTRLGTLLDAGMNSHAFQAIVLAPLVATDGRPKGDPLRDLDAVRSFVSGPGPGVLFDLPWVPIYVVVVYLFHPWLAYLTLAGMAVLVLVMLATELLARRQSASALTRAIMGVRQRNGVVVVITHHPSALAGVDTLMLMLNGRIKRMGKKDEILKAPTRSAAAGAALRVISDYGGNTQ